MSCISSNKLDHGPNNAKGQIIYYDCDESETLRNSPLREIISEEHNNDVDDKAISIAQKDGDEQIADDVLLML